MKKLLLLLLLMSVVLVAGVKVSDYPDYKYNVRWSGARGDSTTDDRAAIQAAIDKAAAVGGGTVWFPDGIYLIKAALTVPSNVSLRGGGRGAQIRQDPDSLGYMVRNDDTTNGDSNIVIEGLFFNGQQSFLNYDSVTAAGGLDAIALFRVQGARIQNNFIASSKRDGIGLRYCDNAVVSGNYIWNSAEEGITSSGADSGGNVISLNTIIGQDSTFESSTGDKGGGILVKNPNTPSRGTC